MSISPRTLFLIDAIGAVVSAFSLGVVLVYFHDLIGVPVVTLRWLAVLALAFACYSGACYGFFPANWRPFLWAIAVVNVSYCVLTVGLLLSYRSTISSWGMVYFVAEVIIIVTLATLEWKTAARKAS